MRGLALLALACVGCGSAELPLEPHERSRQELLTEERPTSPSASLPRFEPSELVESVVSPGGSFRIHFTRGGPNAVKVTDEDGNGIPDAVDTVARTYDEVAVFYSGLGYLAPPSDSWLSGDVGGDGLFDVYLVDFAGRADGAFRADGCQEGEGHCSGYMIQENDFVGYNYGSYAEAVDTVASHEFFHAVQAAYRRNLGSVAAEGTAVWATEHFRPSLEDLEHFSSAYFERPDRSLVVEPDGPGLFAYGSAVFFQFLSERFGDRLIRSTWEESVRAPSALWPELVDTVLRRESGSDFDSAFAEFAQWNMATGSHARPGQGYASGEGYAELAPASKSFPVDEPAVRVAPASTRYFSVPGGARTLSVSFQPTDPAETEGFHLLVAVAATDSTLHVSRVDSPGPLFTQVSALEASRVWVAVVDGRRQGVGRYGRLCITDTATDTPCTASGPSDGDVSDEGCHSAPGGLAWALAGLSLAVWGYRRRDALSVAPPSPES